MTRQWAPAAFRDDGLLYGWDDLKFPSQGINPPGAGSDPSVDSTTGLLIFAGNADNIISGVAQMPHSWAEGTVIRPHIHLRFTTAAADKSTRWKFEYDMANVNGNYVNDYGTYTELSTITVANPNNAKKHVIAGFGDLDLTGYKLSTCLLWRLSRLALSDAADNDTNNCVLIEFDIHLQLDAPGSEQEYIK